MTVLALKGSRAANGVSELHGQVSRDMWQSLFPGEAVGRCPDRPHHQWHSSARLDEGHRPPFLVRQVLGVGTHQRQLATPVAAHVRPADFWERLDEFPGVLEP